MAFASTAELTVAVSGSGAFGFFGAGVYSQLFLRDIDL